ncbi:MAG: hypothetical protein ACRCZF_03155 [Gemmataceae bacterium]
MRRWLGGVSILLGAIVLMGCHHDKYNLTAKFPEEYNSPPDENRYNTPDESGYRRPAARKLFNPSAGMGGPAGVGGPRGGGAMGGMAGP